MRINLFNNLILEKFGKKKKGCYFSCNQKMVKLKIFKKKKANRGENYIVKLSCPLQWSIPESSVLPSGGRASKTSRHYQFSEADRAQIVQSYLSGLSMKSVADIFGCSKQTVHSWVNRFLKNNTLSRTSGSGRRRILSNEVIKKVILKIKRNRLITAREIQEDLGLENVSVRTIQRMISKYTHFKSFWTVRKPLISESNRKNV